MKKQDNSFRECDARSMLLCLGKLVAKKVVDGLPENEEIKRGSLEAKNRREKDD